ncbi:MAG: hypothetical protein ABIY55_03720 [Kofleriaceae bacterium]
MRSRPARTGRTPAAKIDQRRLEPIKPLLAEIDGMREPGAIGRVIARLDDGQGAKFD